MSSDTRMTDGQVLKEFLAESLENLDTLDQLFLSFETVAATTEQIAGIFRMIHTLKGTAGFLGFARLEALTHTAESLLSDVRDGRATINAPVLAALLTAVGRVRESLEVIAKTGKEDDCTHADLIAQLSALRPLPGAPGAEPLASTPAKPAGPAVVQLAGGSGLVEVRSSPSQVVPPPMLPPKAAPPPASFASSPSAAKPREESHAVSTEDSVRIDVGLLDRLMNQVGELVLARNQILQFAQQTNDTSFLGASQRLNLITTELQEHVMKTRMQPISNIWNKLPRVVRDLAVACGKQTRIEMFGKETELDRTILEAIKDPMTHLVRNALDHGIEKPEVRAAAGKARTGSLRLRAFHEGGQVNIEITDDGGGLRYDAIRRKGVQRGLVTAERAERMTDSELAQLLFVPGFSTAEQITNVSGRGVGMDVVKTNIERIGGTVDLTSVTGHGTRVRIKIPLTLAIVPALVVHSGSQRYAIPQVNLLELVRLEDEAEVERVRDTPVYRLRGRLLPLVFLNAQLKQERSPRAEHDRSLHIVVLQADDKQFGLVVDDVRDTEEIVVKPLGKELKGLQVFAGATIMGDGRVALILDVLGLAQRAGVLGGEELAGAAMAQVASTAAAASSGAKQTLLLFGVGGDTTMALPLALVDRLEEFSRGRFEQAGGRLVVQYRGELLPLLEPFQGSPQAPESDAVPVIVFARGRRRVGLVVGRILDVVEQGVALERVSSAGHVLGSAVIQGRVTDLLDVESVMRAHDFAAGGEVRQ